MTRIHVGRCGSTSSVAAAWVRSGGPLPAVVSAEAQLGGRGRWGRSWESPPGGCWFTLALPGGAFAGADDADEAGLPRAAAAAVRRGILDVTGPLNLRVVEPNDLLVGDGKLAGLLCERVAGATLIGVGINVAGAPEGANLRRPATSLAAELGRRVDVAAVRRACVERLLAASAPLPGAQHAGCAAGEDVRYRTAAAARAAPPAAAARGARPSGGAGR